MNRVGAALVFCLVLGHVSALLLGLGAPGPEERLAQHRNLGKAFYENPTTQARAVAEFRQALALAPDSLREKLNYGLALLRAANTSEGIAALEEVQRRDPKLPHTWFNLGIHYRKAGETDRAARQFERMAQLVPEEPIVHYQLGAVYRLQGRTNDALAQFEQAAGLNPLLAAAQFQLYNLYRQTGRPEAAAGALANFQRLRKRAEGAAVPEDVDWCVYAEIYDPPVEPSRPPSAAPPFEDRILEGTVDPQTAGLVPIDSTGTGETDLLVWSSRGVLLFRHGSETSKDNGLAGLRNVTFAAPGDFDNDGHMDLCLLTGSGPLLFCNGNGRFTRVPANLPARRFERAVWLDYDHDYDLDLVLLGNEPALMRNEGTAGFADRTVDFPFAKGTPLDALKLRLVPDSKAFDLAVIYRDRAPVLYRDLLGGRYTPAPFQAQAAPPTTVWADFDNDGRLDRARTTPDGRVHLELNRDRSARRWLSVRLQGVKSLKLAQDAEIEIKAGSLYRKQLYAGVPVLFDTETYPSVDVVRITWPNGLIQNEVNQATNRGYSYREAQRLSGSCPMIWTWNGREMQFITDVLGVAPLGASAGDGSYFPVDHDEYVQIPGSALEQSGGQYDLRITEELSEVSYLDEIKLYALDHRSATEVFTNEKFKAPPYPEFRLFEVQRRVYPESAHDETGRDVLPELLARDRKYPGRFARSTLGVAQLHTLELDFDHAAPAGHGVLLLNGWVDWPDGSTFRAAAQEVKGGLIMPFLQVQDAHGRWTTVNEDMGMPAGKPKTIAVDVHFLSASRKIRIVTNLCVYWDEIFLSEKPSPPDVRQSRIPIVSADLAFRGFSASRIDPLRKQPDTFFYHPVSPVSFWNPTPGLYTRYGSVRDLLLEADDRFVIMGSGDELRLRFDPRALPPVAAGWRRDFLLKVDGWAKDRDPNTAFSSTVEPLPFHTMSRYPYPPTQAYPDDAVHRQYRSEYNTRPALRLIRPLGAEAQ